jgi:hypothetical protein
MAGSHGIGKRRNDYHRPNRLENKGHRRRGGGGNVGVAHIERILSAKISVPKMDKNELIKRARTHYSRRNQNRDDLANGTTLEQVCVDYLRHRLTSYDALRERLYGNAYLLLFKRICEAISLAYPWLERECSLQYARKVGKVSVRHLQGDTLTQKHLTDFNSQENAEFDGVFDENEQDNQEYESSTLLRPEMIYFKPHLPHNEILERRFGERRITVDGKIIIQKTGDTNYNDEWWNWDEETSNQPSESNFRLSTGIDATPIE